MLNSTTPRLFRIGRTVNSMPRTYSTGNKTVSIYIDDVDMLPHLRVTEGTTVWEDEPYGWEKEDLDFLELRFNHIVYNPRFSRRY